MSGRPLGEIDARFEHQAEFQEEALARIRLQRPPNDADKSFVLIHIANEKLQSDLRLKDARKRFVPIFNSQAMVVHTVLSEQCYKKAETQSYRNDSQCLNDNSSCPPIHTFRHPLILERTKTQTSMCSDPWCRLAGFNSGATWAPCREPVSMVLKTFVA